MAQSRFDALGHRTTIGNNLRRLRELAGLGQAELAALLRESVRLGGWTRDTVASVEAGRRGLETSELVLLALFFGVGVIEFFADANGADVDDRTREAILTPPMSDDDDVEASLRRLREGIAEWRYMAHLDYDPTPNIAARLGVKPLVVEQAAEMLWSRTLREEYQARLRRRLIGGVPIHPTGHIRSGVVRGLQKELRELIERFEWNRKEEDEVTKASRALLEAIFATDPNKITEEDANA
jgi:transcriptional regulator with XRE-family HTH domain